MGQQSFEQTLGDNEGKPGMLPFIGAQRVGHYRAPEQQQMLYEKGAGPCDQEKFV